MIRFEYRAWHILTVVEKLMGYWPYQSKMKNLALRIFSALQMWGFGIALREEMFEQVAEDLENIVEAAEVQILRDYSEKGLRFTILSICTITTTAGAYIAMPVVRMFFLYFYGDGVLEKRLPIHLSLPFDDQEYFLYIVVGILFSITFTMVGDFAFDLNIFLTVRHICALFQIIKHRLATASEILMQRDRNNELSDEDEAKAYEMISSAVYLHNRAVQLNESLDDAYKLCWFFILLLNATALAPLPVMIMLYKHDSFEVCRRCTVMIVFLVHFYVIFAQGQMTVDHSESLFDSCYDFCWYDSPKRFRLAVSIMMIRSLTPCRLSGLLFDLSMETYATMLKTALSYISMFQAMML